MDMSMVLYWRMLSTLDEMLWHILVGHKANGIEFNITDANLAQMFENENSSLVGWTQCLEIDKKWYLNIQPNE